MDITKATKLIHIRCPYCKKDLQYNNGTSIKSQKEGLLKQINSLQEKIKESTNPQAKRSYEKNLMNQNSD